MFTFDVAHARLPVLMDIDWHIGDVIAKVRKRHRMNQTVLAEKVGVNKATIVRAEDGDPKVSRETYLKIASVLGTKLVALEVEAARLQEKPAYAVLADATTPRSPHLAEPSAPAGEVQRADRKRRHAGK